MGNQTSTTTDGTATSKTQNSQNELTGVGTSTLVYDNNGNTTTNENGHTLTYDAWNRLVSDSAGTTSYSYDANGRRVIETHGSMTTDLYFTTQGQVIEERQSGTVTAQNVWSIDYVNSLLLRDDNSTSGSLGLSGSGLGNRAYFQHDANSNITAWTDNTGAVQNREVYTSYGQQTVLTAAWGTSAAAQSAFGFQGGRFDVATGMNVFGARDYNPATGIWIEKDPKGYPDGLNSYDMERNSPFCFTDPSGTETAPSAAATQPAGMLGKDRTELQDMIEGYEGNKPNVYADSKGIPTIGIGHNLNSGGKTFEKIIGVPCEDAIKGKITLKPDQVDALFKADLDEAIASCQKQFPNFNELPSEVQMTLVDLTFNMGTSKLSSNFPSFCKSIISHDFGQAAHDLSHKSKAPNSPPRQNT